MSLSLDAACELEEATAEEIVRWAYSNHERVALVASFQAESSVLIDLASKVVASPDVITLDTGRLPEETHRVIDRFQRAGQIRLTVQMPDSGEVAEMVGAHGPNLFLDSVERRRLCCDVRKVRPLQRALAGYDAWITGIRRDQGPTRAGTPVVAPDPVHGGIAKFAPLANWTSEQVWTYIKAHRLTTHPLYERGYTSIGCAPCTRAVRPGEDERAGRWWWEADGVKECGLHWSPEGK